MSNTEVDLPVDLNSEDDTGLPWGFLDESRSPAKTTEGAWVIVGSASTQAVAQVTDVPDGVGHVRGRPGAEPGGGLGAPAPPLCPAGPEAPHTAGPPPPGGGRRALLCAAQRGR